jgi:hypothetical protein
MTKEASPGPYDVPSLRLKLAKLEGKLETEQKENGFLKEQIFTYRSQAENWEDKLEKERELLKDPDESLAKEIQARQQAELGLGLVPGRELGGQVGEGKGALKDSDELLAKEIQARQQAELGQANMAGQIKLLERFTGPASWPPLQQAPAPQRGAGPEGVAAMHVAKKSKPCPDRDGVRAPLTPTWIRSSSPRLREPGWQ